MKKKTTRASRKPTASPPTMLRAYRFDAHLFNDFEKDCVRHLRNPRAVLEALISHWLHANRSQQDTIAEQHQRVESKLIKTSS